jgi:hypothetical protein
MPPASWPPCPTLLIRLQNLKDAASWLGYTYLYVRMLGSPQLYGVPLGALDDDLELEQHRLDLAHSAAVLLDKHNLIRSARQAINMLLLSCSDTNKTKTKKLVSTTWLYFFMHNSVAR